jgi:hypothetical protein
MYTVVVPSTLNVLDSIRVRREIYGEEGNIIHGARVEPRDRPWKCRKGASEKKRMNGERGGQ